jgi:hypothetical protein
MTPTPKLSTTVPKDRARFFYTGAAALLLLLMFLGFQQFYLHGRAYPNRPLTPPIRNLLIAHGLVMSSWLVLLLIQPLLIVNGKYKVHMLLGRVGAVLAACIFALGVRMGIQAARVSPPELRLWNMPYKQFLAVPIIGVTVFAIFVAIGVWYRRRPEIHRPMMLLATLAAIVAALNRIDWITSLYRQTIWGTIFGPFFAVLVIGALLFAVKWALTRSFDRYYALGWAGFVLASAGIMRLATTGVWDNIADFLLQY